MEDLKSGVLLRSAVRFKWLLTAYLPKKKKKHITETCNIGKKALQNLCCGKWFLIVFLISCLNLCCLVLTVSAIFLFCKYDWSILISCPKCLIKLYYPAGHKLANRKLLPRNVTTYEPALNKASNGLFLGCDRNPCFLEPKYFYTLLLSFIEALSTFM